MIGAACQAGGGLTVGTDLLTAPGTVRYLRRRATGSRKNRKKAKNPNQAGEWKANPSKPRKPRNPQYQLTLIASPDPRFV